MLEYAQKRVRAVRDGAQAVRVCFFSPRDSCGVWHRINEKIMTESDSSTLFTRIVDRTTDTGRTSFTHVADFRTARVGPKKVSHVLAALQCPGTSIAGRAASCRVAERPGKNSLDGMKISPTMHCRTGGGTFFRTSLGARHAEFQWRCSTNALFALQSHSCTSRRRALLLRMQPLSKCGTMDVLSKSTSGTVTNVSPIDIFANIGQDGWPKRWVDMLKADSQADLKSLLNTHSSPQSSDCFNRQLASRFGSGSEDCLPLSNCLFPDCALDRPFLRARCPILSDV